MGDGVAVEHLFFFFCKSQSFYFYFFLFVVDFVIH